MKKRNQHAKRKQKRHQKVGHCVKGKPMYSITMSIKERLEKVSKKDHKKNIIYVRVSNETLEKINKLQEVMGIKNRSEAVRILIEDHLENMEKEEVPKAG